MTNRPLTTRLKDENWDMHQIAERNNSLGALKSGSDSKADYIKILEQDYLWNVALDEAVCTARNADQRIADLIPDTHLRALGLSDDLAYFDACPAQIAPSPGSARFIQHIESIQTDPMAVLGIHYVRSGATNGNHFLAKKVRASMSLPDTGEGTRYLDPWGKDQRTTWATFKDTLGTTEFTTDEQDRIFNAVRTTYLYHIGMSNPDRHPSEEETLAAHADTLNKPAFDQDHKPAESSA